VAVYILARGPIDIALLISLAILLNKKAKHIIQILQSKGKSTKKRRKIQENMLRKLRNRWQRFNYRKFLCAAGAHLQATTPPPPTFWGTPPQRRTHARTIFRCWQFWRLLWQHVTCKPSEKSGERRESRGKVAWNAKECLLLSRRYFKLVVARSWPINTHPTDRIEISFKIICCWNSICYFHLPIAFPIYSSAHSLFFFRCRINASMALLATTFLFSWKRRSKLCH